MITHDSVSHPSRNLGELTGADTGGGEKAGDVISGVGHTRFAVLSPSIGPGGRIPTPICVTFRPQFA